MHLMILNSKDASYKHVNNKTQAPLAFEKSFVIILIYLCVDVLNIYRYCHYKYFWL